MCIRVVRCFILFVLFWFLVCFVLFLGKGIMEEDAVVDD